MRKVSRLGITGITLRSEVAVLLRIKARQTDMGLNEFLLMILMGQPQYSAATMKTGFKTGFFQKWPQILGGPN